MHLLNVHTRELQEFIGDDVPRYAILSHTWGKDEVLFQDLSDPKHKEKLGYVKIEGCCKQAIRANIEFVWVDTCCIDKRSSAELSEAINSMFRWYGQAEICYVYLEDVPSGEDLEKPDSAFRKSRWFTRGWTLQELIAPKRLVFFDATWISVFRVNKLDALAHNMTFLKGELNPWAQDMRFDSVIEEITGIKRWHNYFLGSHHLNWRTVPAATRLSWVSGRCTTRIEDIAYCLLGLLDVNMPLLYGEGHKAFLRLQEEFLKKHYDSTILSWGLGMDSFEIDNVRSKFGLECLARTPMLFRGFRDVPLKLGYPMDRISRPIWTMIPNGLNMDLPILQFDTLRNVYLGIADYISTDGKGYLSIPLLGDRASDSYHTIPHCRPSFLRIPSTWFNCNTSKRKTLYLGNQSSKPDAPSSWPLRFRTNALELYKEGFNLDSIYPPSLNDGPNDIVLWNQTLSFRRRHFVLVLTRERRDTLYLRLTFQKRKLGITKLGGNKLLIASCPFEERRSAIEVWDAGRKPWRRCLLEPPQLNWQETTTVNTGQRVERISSTFKKISDFYSGWECTIHVSVEYINLADCQKTYTRPH
ncbi:HET-domain-containing protein [Nemania abortiva]|nr:HET-domain-containing protein [Nemania abortiva]